MADLALLGPSLCGDVSTAAARAPSLETQLSRAVVSSCGRHSGVWPERTDEGPGSALMRLPACRSTTLPQAVRDCRRAGAACFAAPHASTSHTCPCAGQPNGEQLPPALRAWGQTSWSPDCTLRYNLRCSHGKLCILASSVSLLEVHRRWLQDYGAAAQIRDRLAAIGVPPGHLDWSTFGLLGWLIQRAEQLGFAYPTGASAR